MVLRLQKQRLASPPLCVSRLRRARCSDHALRVLLQRGRRAGTLGLTRHHDGTGRHRQWRGLRRHDV